MALEHLFDAELQHQPGMAPLADEGEGVLVGSGDGTVAAQRWQAPFGGRSSRSPGSSSAR